MLTYLLKHPAPNPAPWLLLHLLLQCTQRRVLLLPGCSESCMSFFAFFVLEGPFRICLQERVSKRERKTKSGHCEQVVQQDASLPWRSLTMVVSCLPLPASFFVFRLGPLSSYARASGRQVR